METYAILSEGWVGVGVKAVTCRRLLEQRR
jgi:hypothetical protein